MITKSAALDRFINERVLGDRGFAYGNTGCTYSHKVNGGCEIGQYLPADIAEDLSKNNNSYNLELLSSRELFCSIFEDSESQFWENLQGCHDSLAIYTQQHPSFNRSTYWENFTEAMKKLSESLEE